MLHGQDKTCRIARGLHGERLVHSWCHTTFTSPTDAFSPVVLVGNAWPRACPCDSLWLAPAKPCLPPACSDGQHLGSTRPRWRHGTLQAGPPTRRTRSGSRCKTVLPFRPSDWLRHLILLPTPTPRARLPRSCPRLSRCGPTSRMNHDEQIARQISSTTTKLNVFVVSDPLVLLQTWHTKCRSVAQKIVLSSKRNVSTRSM